MWHIEPDYVSGVELGGLSVVRTYNSNTFSPDSAVTNRFGMQWTDGLDAVLRAEATTATGKVPVKCWRREDTLTVFCEWNSLATNPALPDSVSILRGDGKRPTFNRIGTTWTGRGDTNLRLTADYTTDGAAVLLWILKDEDGGRTERFDASGTLTSISERGGATQRLTYSDGVNVQSSIGRVPADSPICSSVQDGAAQPKGRLLCITDQWGRQVNFEYDGKGRAVKLIDPDGKSVQYEYDGPSGGCVGGDPTALACNVGYLTKVTYQDGKSRTYVYNEADKINGGALCPNMYATGSGFGPLINTLTGLIDENEQRYISWTYECSGRATSSQLGSGFKKVTVTYPGGNGRSVTYTSGTQANPASQTSSYYYTPVLGVLKHSFFNTPCIECGIYSHRQYDANGNIVYLKEWSGNGVCYQYDLGRNLQIVRVEGWGNYNCAVPLASATLTSPARKFTTEWHPTFNLPAKIAQPFLLTTFEYDVSGNLLLKTIEETTDANGQSGTNAVKTGVKRIWRYSYSSVGQLITITGPRIDITDRTSFEYDGLGNRTAIIDPLGRRTVYTGYDNHGRVGTIISPSGKSTSFVYSVRGRLTQLTESAGSLSLSTRYEYDGTGQLSSIALSDGGSIRFEYDSAHQLIKSTDNLGNSVRYVLDLRGNRIEERVEDASGLLRRRVARVFDSLDRMTQSTGVAQ